MPLQGNIETFYISSLLQLLSNDKKTGVLSLSKDTDRIEVFFKDGTIVYASGSNKEQRLGNLLRSEGLITANQLESSLKTSLEKNQKLGRVLLDKGLISKEDLASFIYQQVELILYRLFLWNKGKFDYKDTTEDFEDTIFAPMDTMGIILEASRRVDEIAVLRKLVPSENFIIKLTEKGRKDESQLNDNEKAVFGLIDGKRTIVELVNKSGYDEFLVYKVLYSLLSSGIVEKGPEIKPLLSAAKKPARKSDPKKTNENNAVKEDKKRSPSPARYYIIFAGIALLLSAAAGMFYMFSAEKEDNPSIHKNRFLVNKTAPGKAPQKTPDIEVKKHSTSGIKKKAPVAKEESSNIVPEREIQIKRPLQKTTVYQGPDGFYSLNLPEGYVLSNKSTKEKTETSIKYGPNISIRVVSQRWRKKLDIENEMFKKIMRIKDGSTGLSDLVIVNYRLTSPANSKGYEILLSGIKENTAIKIQIVAVMSFDKAVFVDIICRNWRTKKVDELFKQLQSSVSRTLIIYP